MTRNEYIKWLKQLDENLKFDGLIDGDKEVDLHEMIFDLCEMLKQQTCEDAISRKDTLAKFKKIYFDNKTVIRCAELVIGGMPSVQPEQKPCEDAVSRAAVLDIFADNADTTRPYSTAWEEVKDLPSVNPQPKTGHWIDCGSYYRCSECDNWVDKVDGMPKFCDECGAKMVEPQESEVSE